MELSPKASRYIIDALQHYRDHLDRRLEDQDLPEDESADIGNDREYVAALAHDFQVHHADLLRSGVSLQH